MGGSCALSSERHEVSRAAISTRGKTNQLFHQTASPEACGGALLRTRWQRQTNQAAGSNQPGTNQLQRTRRTGRAAALTHPENGRKNLTLGPEGHTAAHLLAGCASFSLHTSTSAAAPPFRSLDLILPL